MFPWCGRPGPESIPGPGPAGARLPGPARNYIRGGNRHLGEFYHGFTEEVTIWEIFSRDSLWGYPGKHHLGGMHHGFSKEITIRGRFAKDLLRSYSGDQHLGEIAWEQVDFTQFREIRKIRGIWPPNLDLYRNLAHY